MEHVTPIALKDTINRVKTARSCATLATPTALLVLAIYSINALHVRPITSYMGLNASKNVLKASGKTRPKNCAQAVIPHAKSALARAH